MEEKKSSVSWWPVGVLAAAAIAVIALVLNWQARTELRKEIAALSTLQLRSAVLSSEPYRDELQLLQRLSSGDQTLSDPIKALAEFEETGLPSLQALTDKLDQAAASALVAEQSRPELGVFDSLASRIAATAVVVGLQTGSNPLNSELGPIIANAEQLLEEGSIEQSIATLSGLPPELATHFDAWKASAQARMVAEKALNELTSKLVLGVEKSK